MGMLVTLWSNGLRNCWCRAFILVKSPILNWSRTLMLESSLLVTGCLASVPEVEAPNPGLCLSSRVVLCFVEAKLDCCFQQSVLASLLSDRSWLIGGIALCNSDYMVKLTVFSNCILVPPAQFLVFVSAPRKCPEYQPGFLFWLRPCLAAISAHCYCFFSSPNPLPCNTTFS